MKKIIHLIILLLGAINLNAQLFVGNGATLQTIGQAVVTLQHTNLVNNGIYTQAPGGKTIFAGTGNDTILGSAAQQALFDTLEIAKQGGGRLVLLQDLKSNGALKFVSGMVDLHGHVVSLMQNAVLTGETESSGATDTLFGGYLTITRALNAPSAVNAGGLGAIITSTQNMGVTTIRRGHMSQVTGNNTGNSIKRYYDINPANNANLNATLRIGYRDAELNGLIENALDMWKSPDNITWTNAGNSSKNGVLNYVELNGIQDFSRWTLSALNSPLPLLLTRFDADCTNGFVTLAWTTEQEDEVSQFVVQHSNDALAWQDKGVVAFEAGVHSYKYAGNQDKGYYRLAIVDRDGRTVYSKVRYAACGAEVAAPEIWPNPVAGQLHLALIASRTSDIQIQVYDARGALVYGGQQVLQQGRNQINLECSNLAAGTYWLTAVWEGNRKTFKVVKQ